MFGWAITEMRDATSSNGPKRVPCVYIAGSLTPALVHDHCLLFVSSNSYAAVHLSVKNIL